MEPTAPQRDPMLEAVLRRMADIAVPPPISMVPATWGWALLAALVVLLLAYALWLWVRHRARNLYRRQAIAELSSLEASIGHLEGRQHAVAALPAIVKRTALAAWPRPTVAALNGKAWADFLKVHAGKAAIDDASYRFFAETEYRSKDAASLDEASLRRLIVAARLWVEGHDVRA